MIPAKAGPRPVPGEPYAKYPADGPVELWRFIANSLDEPGLSSGSTLRTNRTSCGPGISWG